MSREITLFAAAQIKETDTDGVLDNCHCGARPMFCMEQRIGADEDGERHWVECSECAEITPAFSARDLAMVEWNKSVREIKESEE